MHLIDASSASQGGVWKLAVKAWMELAQEESYNSAKS